MSSYTKISINFLSIIISILIFSILNIFYININNYFQNHKNPIEIINQKFQDRQKDKKIDFQEEILDKQTNKKEENVSNRILKQENKNITENSNDFIEKITSNQEKWEICIPKINLTAKIEEGTTNEIMNKSVGHFIDSSRYKGNVCLAAHNRGYPVNYFQNIKSLRKGDLIIYEIDGVVHKYCVQMVTVIKDTDWKYLEDTEDNRITLITCVENEPEYRRCIQGLEINY